MGIVWFSKMLGRKYVSITLKVYTKYIQEEDDIRLKKIAEIGKLIQSLEIRHFKYR